MLVIYIVDNALKDVFNNPYNGTVIDIAALYLIHFHSHDAKPFDIYTILLIINAIQIVCDLKIPLNAPFLNVLLIILTL